MTKVAIKNEKIMPFGGIFLAINQFKPIMNEIDAHLGRRCRLSGYQYGEIVQAMMCNFLCGGDRTEDINRIREGVGYGGVRLCSPDTALRIFSELAVDDTLYTSARGIQYRFNTAELLNGLLVRVAIKSGQLRKDRVYDLDFDHEFLKSEKWDARWTYKGMLGYSPAVAVLTDIETGEEIVVGVENRDGNANVKFHQEDTLERILLNLIEQGIHIRNARMDCGSYCRPVVSLLLRHCDHIFIRAEMSPALKQFLEEPQAWHKTEVNGIKMETTSLTFNAFGDDAPNCRLVVQRVKKTAGEQLDLFDDSGIYTYRAILTNNYRMSEKEVIEYYNQRGAKERILDQMDNDFGWRYLPKSEMGQNAVFMVLTALIRNFYQKLLKIKQMKDFAVCAKTRMKAFIAKFIAVPVKWVRRGRQRILNIYTANTAYKDIYQEYG